MSYEFNFSNVGLFRETYVNPIKVDNYSSVVDRSRYTAYDNDKKAASSGVDASAGKGLYDLDGTEKLSDIDSKLPDDIIVALRDGRLDKTEIEKLRTALVAENDRLASENLTKKELEKRQKQYQRQLDYIDTALGLKEGTESDSQKLGSSEV